MWQLAANEWQILSIRDDAWLGECWANATLLGRASILPLHLGIRSGGKIPSEQFLIPFSGRNLWPIGERGMGMRGDWGAHYGAGVGNRVLFLAGGRLPLTEFSWLKSFGIQPPSLCLGILLSIHCWGNLGRSRDFKYFKGKRRCACRKPVSHLSLGALWIEDGYTRSVSPQELLVIAL